MADTLERFIADLYGTSEKITTFTVDDDSECWIWDGALTAAGYPEVYDRTLRKPLYAHRVALSHVSGPIPPGKRNHAHHVCGTKTCVNPEHLVVIDAKYHSALTGSVAKSSRTHCNSGKHAWVPENISYKGARRDRYCRLCQYACRHSQTARAISKRRKWNRTVWNNIKSDSVKLTRHRMLQKQYRERRKEIKCTP